MYKQYNYYFPPHNCLAEELLLGTIILHPELFPTISTIIKTDYFFLECHQIIYRSLFILNKENKLDLINLLYILYSEKTLRYIGGISKVIDIIKQSQVLISSIDIIIYIKELIIIINLHYTKRVMIQYGYNVIQLSFMQKLPSHKLYNKAAHYLDFTSKNGEKENLDNFKDLVGQFLLKLHIEKKPKNSLSHISHKSLSYGFKDLDKLTYGISNGDLIIIAGRPSIGKTSFAINIAYNLINNHNISICIFSLEMSKQQIINKFISIASKISLHKIIYNSIDKHDLKSLKDICKNLLRYSIYIYDTVNLSIDYIIYQCQILTKNTTLVQIIIIDYLQLIQTELSNNSNRSQELSYITRKLKILAQQLNIPIIVLSQLNRSVETRINKTPLLSDLRESGCIQHNEFINIYFNNNIHIKYLLCSKYKVCHELQNIRNKYQDNLSTNQVYFSSKYCYKINLTDTNTTTTHNHLLLQVKTWLPQDKINEQVLIGTYSIHNNCLKHVISIFFFRYTKVYDVSLPLCRYFINNRIYVHNSIEQDADIVMILYKDFTEKNNDGKEIISEQSIIDMKICKNRSGPTGYCKFSFTPDNTYFQDFTSNTSSKIN